MPPPQDLKTLVVESLTPLSPEVISRQATINIGACRAHSGSKMGYCASMHALLKDGQLVDRVATATAHTHATLLLCLSPACQAQSGTWHTASRQWSRPSAASKLCGSRMSWSATLRSSSAMPMLRSTAVPAASARRAIVHTAAARRTPLLVSTAAGRWVSCGTCHLSTAQVTIFSWPPCSTALPSWTARCC
jgi:hypothetical protein